MPLRSDIEAVTLHLTGGAEIDFDGADITCEEHLTEYAVDTKPAGKGDPVRWISIRIHLSPDPTLAKGH